MEERQVLLDKVSPKMIPQYLEKIILVKMFIEMESTFLLEDTILPLLIKKQVIINTVMQN